MVYISYNVRLLYQNIGGAGVPCPPLVLPGQVLFSPWCLHASLGVAPVLLLALESFWFVAIWTRFGGGVGGWLVGVG